MRDRIIHFVKQHFNLIITCHERNVAIPDNEDFVNSCETCQKNKYNENLAVIKFNLTPTTSKPDSTIFKWTRLKSPTKTI